MLFDLAFPTPAPSAVVMEPTSNISATGSRRPTGPRTAACLGEWELLGTIGSGEWAIVYRARPRDCKANWPADYAIKVARAGDARRPHADMLILREATVGRSVTHPHLVAILQAHLAASPHYLVMPLLKGATAREAVAAIGPLPTPQALWIVRQTAEALCALHEAGWLHADVKPGNIHVSPSGHSTLVDLGFALQLDSDECARGASLRGTLNYTAPEMISSAVPVDGRSDTYSLGITLFELLAGQPPFADDDPGRLMLAHMQREVPSLRRTLPGLNREVNDLVREMLAKEPLRRPSDQELVQRLIDLELATLEERSVPLAANALRQDAGEFVDQQCADVQG